MPPHPEGPVWRDQCPAPVPKASILCTGRNTLRAQGGREADLKEAYQPRLRLVAVEDLIGPEEIQLAVALFKHVDTRKPPGRRNERLLHAGRVHQFAFLHCAGEKIMNLLTLSQQEEENRSIPNLFRSCITSPGGRSGQARAG